MGCPCCGEFDYLIVIPEPETVAAWEKRKGCKYPDSAPVYIMDYRRVFPSRSFRNNISFCFLRLNFQRPAFGVRAALALIVVLILAGCGGADPKALVQESYKPGKKALDTLSDPALAEKLMKQATIIETKVAKLSEKGRKIYEEELARLIDDDLGGFFDDGLDGVMEAAAEMTDKAQKTADGMINAASKLADGFFAGDAQKALGAAKKAADMLTTLGNQ